MDYRKAMGVEELAEKTFGGLGVTVGILDSGCPMPPWFPDCSAFGPSGGIDDVFGHATAVASILFGGVGISGMCERSRPFYIKVLDDEGHGTVDSVSSGIYAAIERDIDVINLSLGFMRTEKCPKNLEKACERACEAGKIVVCSAGNDGGSVNWPAALKTTICVGSVAENGLKMSFSSVGEVDFVAPGIDLPVFDIKGVMKTVSGTSFSTALVTGVVALVVSKMKAESRQVDLKSVTEELCRMATDVDAPGWDEMTGYGMICGKSTDPTVCMSVSLGFFDKIVNKIKRLIGIKDKGATDGSRV